MIAMSPVPRAGILGLEMYRAVMFSALVTNRDNSEAETPRPFA
jgi:hypothetical protein